MGPAAQVVHLQVDESRLDRLAGQRLSQRVQGGREDRDYVNPHIGICTCYSRSSRPSGGSISTTWSSSDTDVTIALTNGTKSSATFRPSFGGRRTASNSL